MKEAVHFSRSTNLGLQIVAELSRQQAEASDSTRLTAAGISEALDASPTHVAKLISRLVDIGIVKSTRGRSGGIHIVNGGLRCPLGQLIRHLEGQDFQVTRYIEPLTPKGSAQKKDHFRSILTDAEEKFYADLDRFTIADVLELNISGQHRMMKTP